MATGYEIAYSRIIPGFRREIAKKMVNNYGMKQREAALMLGTTQAAISKYLHNDKSSISLSEDDASAFIEAAKGGSEALKRRILCKVCQSNRQFDCAFMVK